MDGKKADRTEVLSLVHPLRVDPESQIQTVLFKIRLSDDLLRDLDEIAVSADFHVEISPGIFPQDDLVIHDILRLVIDLLCRR